MTGAGPPNAWPVECKSPGIIQGGVRGGGPGASTWVVGPSFLMPAKGKIMTRRRPPYPVGLGAVHEMSRIDMGGKPSAEVLLMRAVDAEPEAGGATQLHVRAGYERAREPTPAPT